MSDETYDDLVPLTAESRTPDLCRCHDVVRISQLGILFWGSGLLDAYLAVQQDCSGATLRFLLRALQYLWWSYDRSCFYCLQGMERALSRCETQKGSLWRYPNALVLGCSGYSTRTATIRVSLVPGPWFGKFIVFTTNSFDWLSLQEKQLSLYPRMTGFTSLLDRPSPHAEVATFLPSHLVQTLSSIQSLKKLVLHL